MGAAPSMALPSRSDMCSGLVAVTASVVKCLTQFCMLAVMLLTLGINPVMSSCVYAMCSSLNLQPQSHHYFIMQRLLCLFTFVIHQLIQTKVLTRGLGLTLFHSLRNKRSSHQRCRSIGVAGID